VYNYLYVLFPEIGCSGLVFYLGDEMGSLILEIIA